MVKNKMLEQKLKSDIKKLWDKFWSGGITNPLTAIEQMSYLIFMNRLEIVDDRNNQRAKDLGEEYQSIFQDYDNCRWSKWKHLSGEDMLRHVRDAVFPFIKKIRRGEDKLFAESMQDAVFLIPKPSMLQEAVSIIDSLDVTNQNQDVQGDIYEFLLSELKTSGKNGQFRTPRHIIRMITKLVNPQLGQKVCDPFSGTGGFLTVAQEYILESNTSKERIKYDGDGVPHNIIGDKIGKNKEAWKKLKRNTLFGFDNDTTMIRIALMNMILHGIEHPNIRYSDALSKDFKQNEEYDIILTNPPFTGSIDKADLNNNFKIKSTKTELLAIELFYNLLHTGGKAGIIVPNGVLSRNSNAHVETRKMLLENCQLEAVISLPSGVFQPYSGVGTAVLIFTKGEKTKEVWFYDMEDDGFTLDQKRDKLDGKGDLPDVLNKFNSKEKSEKSFSVDLSTIKENDYSLMVQRYKDIVKERANHRETREIIIEALSEEEKCLSELKKLKEMTDKNKDVKNKNLNEGLPSGWKWKKLGDICDIFNGSTPSKKKDEYWRDGEIPWFTVEDIRDQGRKIKKTKKTITELALKETSVKLLPKETVLICCTASVGEYAITDIPLTTNQQFNGLVIKEEFKNYLLPKYLLQTMSIIGDKLNKYSGATSFQYVPLKNLKIIDIPVPPIDTQQKIISIFDKIEEINKHQIRSSEEIKALSEAFSQKAFEGKL